MIILTLSACTHMQRADDGSHSAEVEPQSLEELISQNAVAPVHSEERAILGERNKNRVIRVLGVELQNTDFDFPVRVNSKVEHWVKYFTGRGRRVFQKYLERSEHFIPYLAHLLKEHDMPQDLVYLAMIESGFNNHAKSRARAVGPWQFIQATGRRYGLQVDYWVDQRRDVYRSTLSAIRYLKDLYRNFNNWELAAAGYNAGEAKIARAIRRYHSRDFWTIARHRYLRPETRNYVPKLIAAAIVGKNRTQFGFEERYDVEAHSPVPENYEQDLQMTQALALAQNDSPESADDGPVLGHSDGELLPSEELSPEAAFAQVMEGYRAHYDGAKQEFPARLVPGAIEVPTPHLTRRGKLGHSMAVEVEVESPTDLKQVAVAAGMSYTVLKSMNPELLQWCTPPQKSTYRIKLPVEVSEKFLITYNDPNFDREPRFQKYKVRRGDTLSRIARRFGTWVQPIKDLNQIRQNNQLRAGKHILIPKPQRSRNQAASPRHADDGLIAQH